jgi:3-oxoacyl-[acyl-carrier-protein] synthase III
MSNIQDVVTYIPQKQLNIVSLKDYGVLKKGEFNKLTQQGYSSVAVDEHPSGIEMIYKALDKLFEGNSINPQQVSHLILTYQLYSFPYYVDVFGLIRNRYSLYQSKFFTVRELHCSTLLMGLEMANTLLDHTVSENNLAIVLSVGKSILPETRYDDVFVTGDSSVALLLNKTHGDKILGIRNITDTRTISLVPEPGGPRWDISYIVNLVKIMQEALKDSRVTYRKLKLIIPNNAHKQMWEYLAKLLKLPTQIFFTEGVEKFGHYFMCDIIINYHSVLRESNFINKGDCFMLLGLGSEGAAGCAVCQKG